MVARIRVGGLAGAPSPATARIRIGGLSGGATAASVARIRIGGLSGSAGAASAVKPFTPIACEPLTALTLTAVTALGSPAPTGYTWARVSGAAVTITGAGASVTVVAPAGVSAAGAAVTIRCTPLVGGVPGIPQDVTITTPQHLRWQMTGPSTLTAVAMPRRV